MSLSRAARPSRRGKPSARVQGRGQSWCVQEKRARRSERRDVSDRRVTSRSLRHCRGWLRAALLSIYYTILYLRSSIRFCRLDSSTSPFRETLSLPTPFRPVCPQLPSRGPRETARDIVVRGKSLVFFHAFSEIAGVHLRWGFLEFS